MFIIIQTIYHAISGGQLPARALRSRSIRRAFLQLHVGPAVSAQKGMGGHEQKTYVRQVHCKGSRSRAQDRRDECTAATRTRSDTIAGEAHS